MRSPLAIARPWCVLSAVLLLCPETSAQQTEGDQFLDGIGETALVARYVLAGNAQDSSRNQRHASIHGAPATYVADEKFGRVLLLGGGNGGFVQIPSEVLAGLDTVSVTGWIYLGSDASWQRFFDFGQDTTAYFFCTPVGEAAEEGFRARITHSGWTEEQGPVSTRIRSGRWVHLTVVLDTAKETLTTYADGKQVAQATNVDLTLEDVLNDEAAESNKLYLGKSQFDTDETLNAKVHDVRIYSIALTDAQVATIHRHALTGEVADQPSDSLQKVAQSSAEQTPPPSQVSAREISSVPELNVETIVGTLPRLPLWVSVTYRDEKPGPKVRVIWPAPENNEQVLAAGQYTVQGRIPGTEWESKAVVNVTPQKDGSATAPERSLEAFPLSDVVLNPDEHGRDTPFMRNRDKFFRGLAATNPDSFLYMFRDAFGQKQPAGAEPMGGWDSQTTRLRGHATGHYLSAIAQAYASTSYDEKLHAVFEEKMDYLLDTLVNLAQKSGKPAEDGGPSNADPASVPTGPGRDGYDSDLSQEGIRTDYWNWGKGFLSAYPPDQFIMLEQGATYGGRNNQIWAPYYTLHKILAGLVDCYEVGGNEKALEAAQGMALWVYKRLRQVPTETRIRMWNRYIAGEYGGMNEVLARLYRLTGDERLLECAQLFDNIDFFFGDAERSHGLARNVDTLRGKHANQHIPQITGALEMYRCTQDPSYYHVADNFWHFCTGSYMYAIGGVAGASTPNNAECFTAQPDSLFENGFSRGGQNETCATYNMLKLSRQLFMYDPQPKFMDYYERALYNHILASVDEDNPGNTYHVPLNPGSRKRFGNAAMDGFSCCNGTALESNTKLQDSIYFKSADNQSLYVNLFVPSTLRWRARDVSVTQTTSFPYSDRTRLNIDGSGEFDVCIRVPRWASNGLQLRINGQDAWCEISPGEYLTLHRTWSKGDTIEMKMPFSFRLSRIMDQPNIASIFYGPVLLAVEEPDRRSDWHPVSLDLDDLGGSIQGDPSAMRFQIGDSQLKPFFETYGRYSVYLDVASK